MTEICCKLKDLISFNIGGGWGSDKPSNDATQVAVIRGADFPAIRQGDTTALPIRWEKTTRAEKRFLVPGDIILEAAGGTSERPTGRSVYISANLLDKIEEPAIPASFCKLLRVDQTNIDPQYLFYNLQNFYNSGGMWEYQVRSSGIANFQLKWFLDGYEIRVPSVDTQRRIAGVLGALDDKIESNSALVKTIPSLINAHIEKVLSEETGESVPVSKLANFVNGGAYTKGATGTGRMVVRIADLNSGPSTSTVYNDIDVPVDRLVHSGDLLMSWSGSLGVYVWVREEAIVNQHIFKVVLTDFPVWLVHNRLNLALNGFRAIAADRATTMGHIQRKHLDESLVKIPIDNLEELGRLCSPLWNRFISSQRESLRLAELRDALLPELMSGRMRVNEAGQLVNAALDEEVYRQ